MQLKVPFFPLEVEYPNTLLNQPGPAARYAEETPPAGRPGRQFRIQNLEEIKSSANKAKYASLGKQLLYTLGGLTVGGLLLFLTGSGGAEGLAVGIATTMIFGLGFLLLNIVGALFKQLQIYPILLLQNDRLFFLNEREAQVRDFWLGDAGKMEKRKVGGKEYLVFMHKHDPKRVAPGSPGFIYDPETEALFKGLLK